MKNQNILLQREEFPQVINEFNVENTTMFGLGLSLKLEFVFKEILTTASPRRYFSS